MTGLLHCHTIWRTADFSKCFFRDYIQTLFPALIGLISLSLLAATIAYHLLHSRSADYNRIDDLSQSSDESEGTEPGIFARVGAISTNFKVKEYFPKPRFEVARKAIEIFSAVALVVVHIVSALFSKHRTANIVQGIFWIYTATLISIKNFRVLSPTWTRTFFLHVVLIVSCSWPLAFAELRSVAVNRVSQFMFVSEVCNFVLVSVLLVLVFTTRISEQPYRTKSAKGLPPTQEPLASLFSRAGFTWVDPIIWKGFFEAHNMGNVWDLHEDDYAHTVLGAFTAAKEASSLTWKLLRHFKGMLLVQGAWAFMYSIFTFVPTLLLKQILEYLEDPTDTPRELAWLFCVGLLLGSIFSTIGNGQALFIGRRISIKLRAIIIGEVYAKALRRKDVSAAGESDDKDNSQANNGQIINLMAIDAFKVSEICAYLHYLVASVPVELVIAIALLYGILGWSALAGIVAMIILLPWNYWMSRQFSKIQEDLMKTTDIRINRMNELLNSIRIIKYFAWESSFMKDIDECRANELKQLRRRYFMLCLASLSWNASPVLITLLTFVTYTKLAGKDLTASVAFTSLSLFNVLRAPLDQLADMITNVLQSKVSVDRVAAFLAEEETLKYDHLFKKTKSADAPKVGFVDGTFTWASRQELSKDPNQSAFQVRDLDVNFPVGELSVVTGPTGSGKTSLLMALLGEMTPIKGDAFLPGARNREDAAVLPGTELTDSVAYCAQSAWLLNDSIRNNILFASEFDEKRYDAVIKACALARDLEILEHGDATEIGEKGSVFYTLKSKVFAHPNRITLSGGQKQRVSLARALYSRARHLLLDDCLSAVDSHTAKWIFENALTGSLVDDRTRILVTHNVSLCLPSAAHVVMLANGRITDQGTPHELLERSALGHDDEALKNAVSASASRANSRAPSRISSRVQISQIVEEQEGPAVVDALETKKRETREGAPNLVQEESRAEGSVSLKVYGSYFKSLGGPIFWVLMALAFLCQQALNVLQTYWIREWARSYQTKGVVVATLPVHGGSSSSASVTFFFPESLSAMSGLLVQDTESMSLVKNLKNLKHNSHNSDLNYYLGIYALLAFLYCVAIFFRVVIVSLGSIHASQVLHSKLLDKVLHSKIRFFDATPLGRIVNR